MKTIISIALLVLVTTACDIKDSDINPDYHFVKVYDDKDVSRSYYPVDAIESTNGSILILSAINDSQYTSYPTIHVMKTDKNGNMVWETNVDPTYISPVSELMNIDGKIRFVCMDDHSFTAQMMEINAESGAITMIGSMQVNYPLAAHYSPETNSLIIASYDGIAYNTVITGYDTSLNISFQLSTPTNKDFSYDIFQHLKKQRAPFPFFIHSFNYSGINYYALMPSLIIHYPYFSFSITPQ